jgi:hypothetical protein
MSKNPESLADWPYVQDLKRRGTITVAPLYEHFVKEGLIRDPEAIATFASDLREAAPSSASGDALAHRLESQADQISNTSA